MSRIQPAAPALLWSISCLGQILQAQQASAPAPTPSDILAAAVRSNGLAAVNRPWHIKAHYAIVSYNGSPKESGTFEEHWASGKQYKRTYASDTFNQTDFANGDVLYRVGDQRWPGGRESQVQALLRQPIPDDTDLADFSLENIARQFGDKLALPCVRLKPKKQSNVRFVVAGQPILWEHYCLEPNRPALRFSSLGAGHDDTTFNDVTMFHNQYLAKTIVLTNALERLSLTIDVIEDLADTTDGAFAPPPGTPPFLHAGDVVLADAVALVVLKHPPAVYPDEARRKGIGGTVTLQGIIGKDGRVKSVGALDGPPELRNPAAESLRQYRFRPFVLLDEPVEVSSKFRLEFDID